MHKDEFVTKWMTGIKSRMAGMCEDGFVVPLIVLFYNDAATGDILESKRRTRLELAAIERKMALVPWYSVVERARAVLTSWRERMAVRIRVWRHQPAVEAIGVPGTQTPTLSCQYSGNSEPLAAVMYSV